MSSNLKIILKFDIFFSVVVFLISLILFIYTRKYSQKKIKFLGLFLDLSKTDSIILASTLLNLLLTIYCVCNISEFGILLATMIIVNALATILVCFNLHLIIAEVVYTSITVVILTLLNLVNTFLTEVNYDKMTHILSIVFLCTIVVYTFYVSVRKLELVLKKNRFVRRNV